MTENENSPSESDNLLPDSPIPDFVITEVEKKQSLKQLYTEANGKEVSLDFFLFTSFEEEQTINSFKGKFRAEVERQRWPVILELAEHAPKPSDNSNEDGVEVLGEFLDKLCRWYASEKPSLAGADPLDYEIHGRLTRSFSLLFQDIAAAVKIKTGAQFKYEPSLVPVVGVWECVHKSLSESFPVYAPLMQKYLMWRHRDSGPVEYDLATLPPVGRFTPLLQREARKARSASVKSDKEISKNTEVKEELIEAEGESDASVSKKKSVKAQSGSRKQAESTEMIDEREAAAQSAVGAAVETLNADATLSSVCLAPCNSYLRRLQHKFADEAGFSSQSVGAGAERSVEIARS